MSYAIKCLLVFLPEIIVKATNSSKCYAAWHLSEANTTCFAIVNEAICLVCPTSSKAACASWYHGAKRIYRNKHSLVKEKNDGVYSTGCHGNNSDKYSLLVTSVELQQAETVYFCKTCNTSYGFSLLTRAKPVVRIQQRRAQANGFHVLDCIIYGSSSQVNITWTVNGEEVESHSRNGSLTRLHNHTVPLSDPVPKGKSQIMCKVVGRHITTTNGTISFDDLDEKKDDGLTVLYISVPSLFTASILTSFFLYFKAKKHRQHKLEIREQNDHVVDAVASDEEVYDATALVYSDITKEEVTANTSANSLGCATVTLNSRLKASGIFEYWSATKHTNSSEEEKCFAKTLSSLATMKDAATFQELALSLKSLKSSSFVVHLLSISVEELPYSLYYEYMECGSLRDFMLRRYQQARKSRMSPSIGNPEILPANVKSQTEELLTFASMVANALKFITSEKFSHPALSLKKVLLSEYCECKLYDIYPTEMAMTKINHLMKKDDPPIAWMAVETIFLQEYQTSSDVWSFAVLLWELFSLGEVPLARNSREEVEKKIREGIVLTQPLCCPGSIYGIMLSCWNNAATKRPTFENILQQIKMMVVKLKAQEQRLPTVSGAPDEPYFVLDANEANNHYI